MSRNDKERLIRKVRLLERRNHVKDRHAGRKRMTKIHSLEFLRRQEMSLLTNRSRRLFKRLSRNNLIIAARNNARDDRIYERSRKLEDQPSPMYSSDWLTIVATLAKMAKHSPEACVIALGLGDPDQNIRPGLLWVVSPDRSTNLRNKTAFQKMFWSCRNRKGTRFIMGLLALSSQKNPESSHMLSYIYDLQQNEIEVFDPNGGIQFGENASFEMYAEFMDQYYQMPQLNEKLSDYFRNVLNIQKVHMPMEWCPVGIQTIEESDKPESFQQKQEDFGGYCAAWSIWWLQERLKYPNVPRAQLIIRLVKQFESENVNLKQWMLTFAASLAKTKSHLMITALREGNRCTREIREMMKRYNQASTKCRRAQNVLYHDPNRFNANQAAHICTKSYLVTDPILMEVTANLESAVRKFSRGRIALSKY